MFCSKEALHRLNNIHERSLRFIHQDYVSNFVTLLINANEKTIHQKCLEFLMIEGYRYLNDLTSFFKLRKNTYDCIAYIVNQIWLTFPFKLRSSVLLKTFKHKIKTWYCNSCLCYCCKPYNHHLGFIKM